MSTAAPAAPPTAAPATDIIPPPSGGEPRPVTEGSPMHDAFSNLEKYAKPKSAEIGTIPKHPREKVEEPPKPPEPPKEPIKEEKVELEEKVEEIKPDPIKVPEDKNLSPVAKLRNAHESLKKDHATLKQEYEKLKNSKPAEDPEKKTMAERLEAREKRLATLEEELKFTAYERSDEYKEKYHTPFTNAYQNAVTRVNNMNITTSDGTTRKATQGDFDSLIRMDDETAAQVAKEVFGDVKADIVMRERDKVIERSQAAREAVEGYRKTGSEREKARSEMEAKHKKEMGERTSALWKQHNESFQQMAQDIADAIKDDPDGQKILDTDKAVAEMVFGDTSNVSPEKLVKLHSEVMNRAARYGVLKHLHKKAQSRITELEAEIEEYKKSEPTKGDGPRGEKAPEGKGGDMDGVFSALEKKARPASNFY